MTKGQALAVGVWVACLATGTGCGGKATPAAPVAAPAALEPVAVVPAAGLRWLLDAAPPALLASPELALALRDTGLDERAEAFARANAGVDVRRAARLAWASYDDGELLVAAGPLDPNQAERTFAERTAVQGRSVAAMELGPGAAVEARRLWGAAEGGAEHLVVLGPLGLALERGPGRRAQAAELFARGRLHRARPALASAPLDGVAVELGEQAVRVFLPGPVAEELPMAGGLGESPAVALGLRPVGTRGSVVLTAVAAATGPEHRRTLAGALARAAEAVRGSVLGRALGVTEATVEVEERPAGAALIVRLDGPRLIRGLHRVIAANVREIMAPPPAPDEAR